MRIALLLLLVSAVCFTGSSPAQTVNATYQFVDILSSPQAVKRITLTMQDAFADNTNAIITTQPITRLTDTNGTYTFTNVSSGYTYRIQLDTPFGSTIRTNGFPTGLTGNVNARDYLGVKVGQVFAFFYQTNGSASWSSLSGKPTTLAGFGITDAASASALIAATNAAVQASTNYTLVVSNSLALQIIASTNGLTANSQPGNSTLTNLSGLNTNQLTRPDQLLSATNSAVQSATNFTMTASNLLYVINVGMTNAAVMASTNFTMTASNAIYTLLVAYTNGAVQASTNYTVGVSNALYTLLVASTNGLGTAARSNSTAFQGAGLSVLKYTNGNTVYVNANGSDSTGVRGVPSLAATTISNAAINLAVAGDLVLANPGLHTNNNILAQGVNYFLTPGVSQLYVQPGNDVAGKGFIDDRSLTGGTTNIIVFDSMFFQGFTNQSTNLTAAFNVNSDGAITQTNNNSRLYIKGRSLKVDSVSNLGQFSGILQQIGTNAYMDVSLQELIDPYFGTTMVISNTGFGGATVAANRKPIGIYWGEGNMHANINRLQVPFYGIWGNGLNTVTTNDLYYTGDDLLSKIYLSPASTNYISWINVKQLKVTSANGSGALLIAADFYGGKNYLTAQKIEGASAAVGVQSAPSFNWINTLKTAAGSSWFNGSTGLTWMASQAFEDLGSIQVGFNISGGALFMNNGGDAKVVNGKGIMLTGGTAIFDGQHIDTSATDSTNNNPVFVTTNGLTLHNVVLTAPASAYSMSATNAQTVTVEGWLTANTAISPLVTPASTSTNYAVNVQVTGSLMPPRLTKTQRNAVSAMAGMVVYQTDNTPGLRAYNGTHWVRYTETNDD